MHPLEVNNGLFHSPSSFSFRPSSRGWHLTFFHLLSADARDLELPLVEESLLPGSRDLAIFPYRVEEAPIGEGIHFHNLLVLSIFFSIVI